MAFVDVKINGVGRRITCQAFSCGFHDTREKRNARIMRVFVLNILLLSLACAAYGGDKIAVLDFKSILAPPELGTAVAEILRTELIGFEKYTVIERGMLEHVLQEQELQMTGVVDEGTAVDIGRLAGAKFVVIGSLVKTGAVYTINSRVIDVETGIAQSGQNIHGEGEERIPELVRQLALILAGETSGTENADIPQPSRLLFSFEEEQEVSQWAPFAEAPALMQRAERHATDGAHSLHVIFPKATDYPEIDTTSAPRDWSAYQSLSFDVYDDSGEDGRHWELGIRIDDRRTTHLNQQWFVRGVGILPGRNTIRIPLADVAQRVNLQQIQRVMLFVERLERKREIYLDHVRLESKLPNRSREAVVFSFETRRDLKAWQPTAEDRRIDFRQSNDHAASGASSLRVTLPKTSSKNEYPGILTDQFPRDWSLFFELSADVWLEMKKVAPITLGVRIDDAESTSFENRFHWETPLRAGANSVRIPVEQIRQTLDLSRITAVYFFLLEPQENAMLYFDRIRLE